jgi:hypothetical protein
VAGLFREPVDLLLHLPDGPVQPVHPVLGLLDGVGKCRIDRIAQFVAM